MQGGRAGVVLAVTAGLLALVIPGHASAAARATETVDVRVTLTDSSFSFTPQSLQAGPTTFLVVNKGRHGHALAITGPGLKGVRTSQLTAGTSARLSVTLRQGAYMLSDPVGLSAYNVQYVDVSPAEVVSAGGNSSTVATTPQTPPMCGLTYTP